MKRFRFFVTVLLILPYCLLAQQEIGIQWDKSASWELVAAKAKKEKKYIFVDCYATWCRPCKAMDRDVFSSGKVGEYANRYFISAKVQIDSSKNDDMFIKEWYSDAKKIATENKIKGFPSYLFFSPEGKLVHRSVGFKNEIDFLKELSNALNLEKQVVSQYTLWQNKKIGYEKLLSLVSGLSKAAENDLAKEVATDYLENYLSRLNTAELLTIEQLEFLKEFQSLVSMESPIIQMLIKQSNNIDTLMKERGYTYDFLNGIISANVTDPALNEAKGNRTTPDWGTLRNKITTKTNKLYAERAILELKTTWYMDVDKDSNRYLKALIKYMEIIDIDRFTDPFLCTLGINNRAWEVFEHSQEKNQLRKAIEWVDVIIQKADDPTLSFTIMKKAEFMDTKANLMYKLGLKKEAIALEEEAVKLSTSVWRETALTKMKNGERTWGGEYDTVTKKQQKN
jgi:thioredoxin-related protein